MKQKKTVLVLLLAFVLLLGGAYLLYTRLEGSVNTYQLSAQEIGRQTGQLHRKRRGWFPRRTSPYMMRPAMRFTCPTTSASR